MSLTVLAGLFAGVDPSPSPTAPQQLQDWEVSPGLEGFLATFAVAAAAVVLFLSLSRHMRKANAYARANGIEVEDRRTIGFRSEEADGSTPDGGTPDGADASAVDAPAVEATPDDPAAGPTSPGDGRTP